MKTTGLVFSDSFLLSPTAPATGVLSKDVSRFKAPATENALTYTKLPSNLWYKSFNNATPSYVTYPAANTKQLNFTSNSFTILCWAYSINIGAAEYLITQGATDVDGWGLFLFTNNISLRLNQAAGHTDISAVNGFAYSAWQMIGVTRVGNTGQFYNNGLAIATIGGGGLVNAVSVAGGNALNIGIADGLVLNAYEGYLGRMRVWNYALPAGQILKIFESERSLYGV